MVSDILLGGEIMTARELYRIGRMMLILAAVALVAVSIGVPAQADELKIPTSDANKILAKLYFSQIVSEGDAETVDLLLGSDYQYNDRGLVGQAIGAKSAEFLFDYAHRSLTDIQFVYDEIVAEGDNVAVCWTAHGVFDSAYGLVAPTGEEVSWTGMSFLTIKDGRIVGDLTNQESLAAALGADEIELSWEPGISGGEY